jgi:periplasmic divalent cation tolerance protein
MQMEAVVVLVTAPPEEAEGLAQALVEARVAACVNLLPKVRSWFRWEGAVERAEEALLVIKSTRSCLEGLIAAVRERHSYQVFAAVALPIADGFPPYLQWIASSVSNPEEQPR